MSGRRSPSWRRLVCAATVLAAASALTSASAQDRSAADAARIDYAFDVAPRNVANLAIPLTRRALAKRAAARKAWAVEPQLAAAAFPVEEALQLSLPEQTGPAQAQTVAWTSPGEQAASADAEAEASAEGDADDAVELARLPRPRPGDAGETIVAVEERAGEPLDLVAGAAEARAPDGEPAPAVPEPTVVTASLDEAPLPVFTAEPAVPVSNGTSATPAAPRRSDCLSLDGVADKDGDFRRNAAALSDPAICISQAKFKERRRPWTVQTIDSGRPGPLWAVMHDDEADSFDSAVWGLKTYGGRFVTVETGGKRNQDGIDPNRNFSNASISCAKLGKTAAPRFTAAVAAAISDDQPLIALHNNYDGHVPTGGLGHVSMSTVPRDMRAAKSNDPDGPLAGEHNLVLLAAAEPVAPRLDALMEALSGQGINVVLETVAQGRGDCSLSNYAALSGHERYFNVTVDHDASDRQRKIVDVIMEGQARVAALP